SGRRAEQGDVRRDQPPVVWNEQVGYQDDERSDRDDDRRRDRRVVDRLDQTHRSSPCTAASETPRTSRGHTPIATASTTSGTQASRSVASTSRNGWSRQRSATRPKVTRRNMARKYTAVSTVPTPATAINVTNSPRESAPSGW